VVAQSSEQALYGVGIHEAIKSGDMRRMKAIAKEAEQYLGEMGDIRAALEILKGEILRGGTDHPHPEPPPPPPSPGPIPLYGVIIHEAIAAGDVEKMTSLVKEAEAHVKEHGNIRAALTALRAELGKG